MRVLEIETFGRGGLAHYAHNLSAALAALGHEVTLVTAAGYEFDEADRSEASFEVVPLIARGSQRRARSAPAALRALWRKPEALVDARRVAAFARRRRPDVVHLHCTNPVALAYLSLLTRQRAPVVATAHVVTPHEPIPFERPIYRRVHALGDLIVAHSEFDRRRLEHEFGVEPGRVAVIPHGEYGFFERAAASGEPVDRATARASLGLAPDDEVALFFGYIREYKGLDVLLDAWPSVAEARPRARLLIAGDPVRLGRTRRRELERLAEHVGAVRHFGYVPFERVRRYFAAADALVMPYRRISQSGVLYLALALDVPVVATRVGGLPELLRDGESALLVPPESPGDLASALGRALGDAELRRRLARAGRRLASEHSWPSIAERTQRVFEELSR